MKIVSSISAFALCVLATNAFATSYQSSNGYQITPPDKFIYRSGANITVSNSSINSGKGEFDSFFVGPNKETVSVVVKAAPPQITLPMLLQFLPQLLEKALTNKNTQVSGSLTPTYKGKTKLRFLSKGYTTMGGTKAVTFLSRIEVGSPKDAVLVRQVAVLRKGWMYTFSCTAPAKTFWKMSSAFNRTLTTVCWTR